MIVRPDRLRDATIDALESLAKRPDIPQDVAMELQIAAGVLGYSKHLTNSGEAIVQEYSRKAMTVLESLSDGMTHQSVGKEIRASLALLQKEALLLAESSLKSAEVLDQFDAFLKKFDSLLSELSRSESDSCRLLLAQVATQLSEWQLGLNALSQVFVAPGSSSEKASCVNTEDMQSLLRQRMGRPNLVVSDWTVLPGGFGKETCLFSIADDRGCTQLVMRRDVDASLITGVDCHEVKQEYPLLKAVFNLGFPVPEPLLMEVDSTVVTGPDFIIMRRMPGRVEGSVLGGVGKVDSAIQRELASVTARLHKLPAMPELEAGTPELNPALWDMTTAECMRHYIGAWYRLYLAKAHMPIPAIHGMVNWLLSHVPESQDKPTLIHGDIGLHNLLFHEGRLSTVLDWEFSHIGDPAEDLGIVYTVMREQLDWDAFLDEYRRVNGSVPSMARILYFEIWMNFRNLLVASIALGQFANGQLNHIRYGVFATRFIPHYIERVSTLIRDWKS